ncbi:phosphodiester glycosidase family protein [Streptomyces sp. NPDC087850]|uniref:phosphodiester glycosidase family protein n=1 Tax=Streptomyces sp. NPDC087850 TaxID=3365809 RepID=UPI0037F6D2BA
MPPALARRTALLCAALTVLTAGGAPPSPATAVPRPPLTGAARSVADGDGIETARVSRPLAPGVRLTSYDRYESATWLRVDSLRVDLRGGARADYLSSGRVTDRRTVSQLAARHDPGPGRRTVAAVNADFFDLNGTGAPLGPGIADGTVVHSPQPGAHTAAGIGPGAAGRVLRLYFDGTVTLPSGPRALEAYNAARVPPDGIGAYTAGWGEADRARTVDRADPVAEAAVRDGRVVSVTGRAGTGPIGPGTTVLVGREAGARALAALRPGDPVAVAFRPRTDGGPVPRTAVGGRELLVVDGVARDHEGRPNNTAAPRTAIGFSRDGATMQVITVDGRQADSGGVTLTELGLMMRRAGAHSALNLDGGGSSTLVARVPGSDVLRVENSPSDGAERPVPNGLALTAPDGSGRLEGFWVETRTPPTVAPGTGPVGGGRPERVFPGLTRRLTAAGYDETYGPAAGTPRWTAEHPSVGRIDGHGVFTARASGATEVRAAHGRATGATRLTVVGALTRIAPTTPWVPLADATATGTFGIVGSDATGTGAPVEPADITLDYDRSLLAVTDDGRGSFTVRSLTGAGAGHITAAAGGVTTTLAVSVGLAEHRVSGFDDAASWTFAQARASGSVAATPDGHEGTGLTLAYDFTGSTATRAAYAHPPGPLPVPGRPRSLALRIKGDGRGALPTLQLRDAAGSDHPLRGPRLTWTGWRQVTFDVPAGAPTPLTVVRFYLAETSATARYTGAVTIDELTARVPPDVAPPPVEPRSDPLIGPAAAAAGREWRFAVLSDARFVARDPDSAIVARTRRTLREIRAAGPDFLVINGDLVDEGSPAGLDLARRLLDEELGDALPWYYVPGDHEVRGGSIGDFTARFGSAHRSFDHRGTRFLTLDTSRLTLRGGGLAQVRAVRDGLDAAAADDRVGSVLVVGHVPPRDPTVEKAGELTDRKEAALLEEWLAGFRRTTGKGAGFIGAHAGVFDASRVDGVPYLVNGNAGRAPAGPAAGGGFTGWSLIGVDRLSRAAWTDARRRPWRGGPDWISVQTRPHTDALTLDAPDTLAPGHAARVRAAVLQGTRTVPVGFPLSADWAGSPGLRIGRAAGGGTRPVAAFDPATATLTALRPGTVTLAVTVGGLTRRAEIRIGEPRANAGGCQGSSRRSAVKRAVKPVPSGEAHIGPACAPTPGGK